MNVYIDCLMKNFLYSTFCFIASVIALKLWLNYCKGVCKCRTELHGKVVIITGGNSGIGLETARDLAKRGAEIIIASRNVAKSEEAVADIVKTTGNVKVHHRLLNLADFSSVKEFVKDFNKTYERLDILVNNAGIAGLRETLNQYGIDKVTQINYVGPFLLTNLLRDKLIASTPSRIVIVSSYANILHDFDGNDLAGKRIITPWKKYCNSKLYNVLWAKALSKRLPEGVTVNSLHPGVVKTDIFMKWPAGLARAAVIWIIGAFFKTPEEGAQTSIHLCVAPELETVSGEYFSDCDISSPATIAKSESVVNKLWEDTMLLVKNYV